MRYFNWVTSVAGQRIGITHDLVQEGSLPYLERWILWCGITLRVHKFHKGDDDRAYHDHPWWFVTVPLKPYLELTPGRPITRMRRFVPQFRSTKHQHIVKLIEAKPVWTIILTGPKSKEWGFWEQNEFTHHQHWLAEKNYDEI